MRFKIDENLPAELLGALPDEIDGRLFIVEESRIRIPSRRCVPHLTREDCRSLAPHERIADRFALLPSKPWPERRRTSGACAIFTRAHPSFSTSGSACCTAPTMY